MGEWTHFWDMHSGGGSKLEWEHVFIEADEATACKMFAEAFGRDPENTTCDCCGGDYAISESESLEQATAFHRHCSYASPLSTSQWAAATSEERQHANRVGRYVEPDEDLPEGWDIRVPFAVEHGYVEAPQSFADFLESMQFVDMGSRECNVKVLARPEVSS